MSRGRPVGGRTTRTACGGRWSGAGDDPVIAVLIGAILGAKLGEKAGRKLGAAVERQIQEEVARQLAAERERQEREAGR
jgi:hypothetical protein